MKENFLILQNIQTKYKFIDAFFQNEDENNALDCYFSNRVFINIWGSK